MERPRISIIIPVYNVAHYVENCLNSVIEQDYDNLEIILIDDCGSDNSIEKVKLFSSSHSGNFVLLSHDKNRGLSAARNTGVKHAKGDYLFFLDSDDELPKDAIKIFVQNLQTYGDADFLIGNYLIKGDFKFEKLATSTVLESTQDILNSYILGKWYVMACGKLIHRAFFINNDLWFAERRLHEDELFSFRLALVAKRMVTVQSNVYIYIIRTNSITTQRKGKNYTDLFWILQQKSWLIREKRCLFKAIDGFDYVVLMLFNYAILVTSSCLPHYKKMILLKWVRMQLGTWSMPQTSFKISVLCFILSLPLFALFACCKFYSMRNSVR